MPRVYQRKLLADGSANPKYKYRKRPSGKSGKRLSKFKRGAFLAWDGEGITRADGSHIYTMLVNSEGDALVNMRDGLSSVECLDMLCRVGEQHPKAIHVAFGASYDVNMMLADCTRDEAQRIWRGEWVELFGKFVVCYRARKSFTVRRKNPFTVIEGKLVKRKGPSVVLWDVFGFFQSSFVSALEKYLGRDHPDLELIREHKAIRHEFIADNESAILEYCRKECAALVALMGRMREYLEDADLKISRWDGAGACAAALLRRERILEHKGTSPPEVLIAAQHAYAGGRSELFQYGHAPTTPVFHYDINSAYPSAMRELPSLARGIWRRHDGQRDSGAFSLYRVRWRFRECVAYPYFWRAFDTSIFYPQSGEGWYWKPEVDAARDAMACGALSGTHEILECWEWVPETDDKPFAWLPPLYQQRKEWKAVGIGAEKVLKLAINSLYGKTAQHLGGTENNPPRFHQLEWAGWITSYTRAMLYRALTPLLASERAIMVATDAVYSLDPLTVPCGDDLGTWSYEPHDGITVVQSGVYWTYNDGVAANFCRGFDKGSLDVASIVRAWRRGDTSADASLTRFATMGTALQGADSFEKWRTWRTTPRTLALTPSGTKRASRIAPEEWTRKINPGTMLLPTAASIPAAQLIGQTMSAPYPLPWANPNARRDVQHDGTPLAIVETEHFDAML